MDDQENNLEAESEITSTNEIEFSESDEKCKREENSVDCIFRIAFNDEDKFNELKEGIINSLSTFFETKQIDVEFLEDQKFLNITVNKNLKNNDIPLFMISVDTTPKLTIHSENIPSYRRSIKDVLDFGKLNESNETCERPNKTNLCFNCAGCHALKDCPEPRNQQKINKARKQFLTKNERYHIDIDQRCAHLKPGNLSNNLKMALGLKNRELPSFFYRMRLLGYPPGWLEDSKIANSGITVIDSEVNTLTSDSYENNSKSSEQKYDTSKILSFPGFNTDPGSGYYDDYKYHNVPAINVQQSKEIFIKMLGGNVPTQNYKRKISNVLNIDNYGDSVSNKELTSRLNKVSRFNSPLNEDLIEQPLNFDFIKEGQNSNEINNQSNPFKSSSRKSPTLADLQAQQEELLKAIKCENHLKDGTILKSNDDSGSIEEILNNTVDNSSISENLNTTLQTPKALLSNKKISVLGTPVLKFSEFDQLPNGENFKQGVSDVINFDNLPDSTGKYEEMKIVLHKVRTKINKLNSRNN